MASSLLLVVVGGGLWFVHEFILRQGIQSIVFASNGRRQTIGFGIEKGGHEIHAKAKGGQRGRSRCRRIPGQNGGLHHILQDELHKPSQPNGTHKGTSILWLDHAQLSEHAPNGIDDLYHSHRNGQRGVPHQIHGDSNRTAIGQGAAL